jgi:Tfp pilus assembly protein PilO
MNSNGVKKMKTIWLTVASGIFSVLMIGAFIWVLIETGVEKRKLSLAISTQEQASAKEAYGGSLRALARDTKGAREKLISITKDRDLVSLIQILEDSGEISGVKVSIDAVSSGADYENFKSVIVAVSSSGSFQKMVHLMSILESLPAISSISQFELEKESNSSVNWQLQVRVRFLVESEA